MQSRDNSGRENPLEKCTPGKLLILNFELYTHPAY